MKKLLQVLRPLKRLGLLSLIAATFGVPTSAQTSVDYSLPTDANYLSPGGSSAGDPLIIDLAAIGVTPGTTLTLTKLGGMKYNQNLPDGEGQLLGAFSSTSALLQPGTAHRIPGAIDAGSPFDSNWVPLGDIPEDFLIASEFFRPGVVPAINSTSKTILIPVDASHLFVMVYDNHYGDNINQGLGVRLTWTPLPPLTCLYAEDFEDFNPANYVPEADQTEHYGQVVIDPVDPGNHALNFFQLEYAGDMVTAASFSHPSNSYVLELDYYGNSMQGGHPGNLGGFVRGHGASITWLAGTTNESPNLMNVDDQWTHITVFFTGGSGGIRLGFEDYGGSGGVAGDFYFDNIKLWGGVGVPPSNSPPIADAGEGQSVNEGQMGVVLDGSGSSDPDSDPLTYAWLQLGGTSVALSDTTSAQPTFTAPTVAIGGETLTFELTVAANDESVTDTVNVSVVNVNHPPVAEAGADQSIAEGSQATLQGGASFDIDMDSFTYSWTQTGGLPIVTLTGVDTANPTFDAPYYGTSGAPGVVGTLVFELTVDDGFPQDAPAPGYTLADVVDYVTIQITNINNDPTANADVNQMRDENASVTLSGMGSSDPDGDPLTYAWTQIGGTIVTILDAATVAPSFTTPFVNAGGEDLTFELTVNDGYSGMATDTMVVHVQNANDPPNASAARPTVGTLWPPNHKMVAIGITGVTDPNDNATIVIDGVTQDEPTAGTGDGDTAIDAIIKPDGTVLVRAERSGSGDGRVYHIYFTASDLEGSTSGVVTVSVPKKKKQTATDGGSLHDSTN